MQNRAGQSGDSGAERRDCGHCTEIILNLFFFFSAACYLDCLAIWTSVPHFHRAINIFKYTAELS